VKSAYNGYYEKKNKNDTGFDRCNSYPLIYEVKYYGDTIEGIIDIFKMKPVRIYFAYDARSIDRLKSRDTEMPAYVQAKHLLRCCKAKVEYPDHYLFMLYSNVEMRYEAAVAELDTLGFSHRYEMEVNKFSIMKTVDDLFVAFSELAYENKALRSDPDDIEFKSKLCELRLALETQIEQLKNSKEYRTFSTKVCFFLTICVAIAALVAETISMSRYPLSQLFDKTAFLTPSVMVGHACLVLAIIGVLLVRHRDKYKCAATTAFLDYLSKADVKTWIDCKLNVAKNVPNFMQDELYLNGPGQNDNNSLLSPKPSTPE
jgi:hypothetical protein